MRIAQTIFLIPALLVAGGCENEGSPKIESALAAHERAVQSAVGSVRSALQDPNFVGLSSGIQQVELACQQLLLIEVSGEASPRQKLRSIILTARAWDRVAASFEHVRPDAAYDEEELELFQELLGDKGLPARVAAEAGYIRALDFACREGVLDRSPVDEALEGIERLGGAAPNRNTPCSM